MFNFRPDRAREITRAFCDETFDGFERTVRPQDIYYVCMTQYDATLEGVHTAFPPEQHKNTLGEYLSRLERNSCALRKPKIRSRDLLLQRRRGNAQ